MPQLVLVTDYWPPFRIDNGQSPMSGVDIELVSLLEARLKVRIQVRRVPWVRALAMMRDGQADLMSGLARTTEREAYIAYAGPPYAEIRAAFYALADTPVRVARYADLDGRQIGYTRGSAYFEPFDSDSGLKKYAATDEAQLLRMLLGRRLDLIVGSDLQVDYELKRGGFAERVLKQDFRPERGTSLYVGISRRSAFAGRESELGRVMGEIIADGSLRAVFAAYGLRWVPVAPPSRGRSP